MRFILVHITCIHCFQIPTYIFTQCEWCMHANDRWRQRQCLWQQFKSRHMQMLDILFTLCEIQIEQTQKESATVLYYKSQLASIDRKAVEKGIYTIISRRGPNGHWMHSQIVWRALKLRTDTSTWEELCAAAEVHAATMSAEAQAVYPVRKEMIRMRASAKILHRQWSCGLGLHTLASPSTVVCRWHQAHWSNVQEYV